MHKIPFRSSLVYSVNTAIWLLTQSAFNAATYGGVLRLLCKFE